MLIYKITNKINGKSYIGQTTKDAQIRWKQHCKCASHCHALSSAIKKYGKDNFTIEEICIASDLEDLNKKESNYIIEFNTLAPNGYNLTSGGKRPLFSEETKKRMGSKGKNHYNYGKKVSGNLKNFIESKKRQVICNETNVIFESVSLAAKSIGSSTGNIIKQIQGKLKTVRMLTFSYYHEGLNNE